jgi:NADPH-dependent 2,4-dienoyl-CoA reductase/sulfur reductase-like enzyme/peroxiredoxin family protein/TusA-related sulfurtransferase/rhodanese-related sulfurtransferase
MGKKVLVVGGVAGGASAAARLRRLDESAQIILFERGEHISFANCGLPYYVGGVISERESLLVQTPEAMKARFGIDIRVNSEVTAIIPGEKQVEVRETSGRSYRESFDSLILSPGANPIRPPIPGIDSANVFSIRNIPDVEAVKAFVDANGPRTAVVVGGGFIGLEMAENLVTRGISTTIVEMLDQVMAPLDYEMAAIVQANLRANGINLVLKDGVSSFETRGERVTQVGLKSGRQVPAEMVVLAIGVKPEVALARRAGLAIGERGGIRVNDRMQTSDPNIFAIGDAVEVKDLVTGQNTLIPLAGPANKQGRIVADVIAGRDSRYEGTQGTSIVKLFDCVAAATGANEKVLKRAGMPYQVSYTHPGSHAGYFPGSLSMSVKLVFAPETGKVLGAQIVGFDGVDKRIDDIAGVIRRGGAVRDLMELELAYAPPFSSAKDPVNMAGFVADDILRGDVKVTQWHEVAAIKDSGAFILDVRTPEECSLGSIAGSTNIPVDSLRDRIKEIPTDREVLVYCAVGLRGYIACRILAQRGFKSVRNLSGGWKTYSAAVVEQKRLEHPEETLRTAESQAAPAAQPAMVAPQRSADSAKVTLDACGLQCPGPIVQVFKRIQTMQAGEMLEVKATDPGFMSDIRSWCETTGNELVRAEKEGKTYVAEIRKGVGAAGLAQSTGECGRPIGLKAAKQDDKTMVVFSGDLDKAIASFVIATGAASMGKKVTMFFTFWGLNVLRKSEHVKVKKGFMDRMFGMMMPRGSQKLRLSQMNMGGMGSRMIRGVMRKKNILSLEDMMAQARQLGVRMVACSMSMDVMGITRDELVDGVEVGGVATFLNAAELSDTTLFI